MPRMCDWCREPIGFFDAQTSSGRIAWHTHCWNEAAALRAEHVAECEDAEGFSFRPLPEELLKSETGSRRSEVIPIMATATATTTNAKSNTRAPREVVEFPPNVPVTVALKYPHARTVGSQYGERFMFSLVDGRVMFLDPEVGGKIEALGINVRENFTITRKSDGQKDCLTTWEVARVPGEQPNGTLVLPAIADTDAARSDGGNRKPAGRAYSLLVDETNALVDAYAQVLDRTLNTYQGRIKPEEARSLLVTAYIQRSKLSSVA